MFLLNPKAAISAAATALAVTAPSALGTTIATTTFDTDSYIPFKTNNSTATEITVGAVNPGYNFNFGVIEFGNLDGVSATGDKFLVVDLEAFVTLGDPPPGGGAPPTTLTPTGTATIKVVGLDSSYQSVYADGGTVASAWYDTYIGNATADAEATATNAGLVYFDVTEVVDAWLDTPSSNYGFGLVVTSGQSVELGAGPYEVPDGNGGVIVVPTGSVAPALSTVPEPTSLALLAMGVTCVLRRRR